MEKFTSSGCLKNDTNFAQCGITKTIHLPTMLLTTAERSRNKREFVFYLRAKKSTFWRQLSHDALATNNGMVHGNLPALLRSILLGSLERDERPAAVDGSQQCVVHRHSFSLIRATMTSNWKPLHIRWRVA